MARTYTTEFGSATVETYVRTYYETIAPGGYRRSPAARRRLIREHLDASGHVVRVEVVCEVA